MMVRDKPDVLRDRRATRSRSIADARSPGNSAARNRSRARACAAAICRRQECPLCNPAQSRRHPETAQEIRAVFQRAGVDLAKPVVTSCGSGVTAAILSLGLALIGHNDHALYDGSWTEWGSDPSLPVETKG